MRLIVLGVCLFAAACSGQSLEFTNVAHERQLGAGSNSGARWHGAAVPRFVHDSYRCSAAFCPRDCRGYCDPPRSVHRERSQPR